ncbi:MAG: sodium/proton antiporter complex Mrp, protein [Pseudomonadota bacterium]|jgi:multicomponent Na+:H+ antiporter subunit E
MLLGNIALAVAWAALQGEFSLAQLLLGYALGYVLLAALAQGGVVSAAYPKKVRAVLSLLAFLFKQFLVANLRMAIDVMGSKERIRPAIVRVPLDATEEYEILLLSTLINLTPGSIALDVTNDRRALYVHVMHLTTPEAIRAEIKSGFERRVLEVLR